MKIYNVEQIKFIKIEIDILNNIKNKTIDAGEYNALDFAIGILKNMI